MAVRWHQPTDLQPSTTMGGSQALMLLLLLMLLLMLMLMLMIVAGATWERGQVQGQRHEVH